MGGFALPLLKGRITLQDALTEDVDILQRLLYPKKRLELYLRLFHSQQEIAKIVSRHLNLALSDFKLAEVEEWVHGSFNLCIPIDIAENKQRSTLPRRALIRFPLPYKVGEEFCPGNLDEKLRCEAATYLWLQQNCPDVPIPRLFGFGLHGSHSFTAVENESIFNRIIWHFRRAKLWLLGQTLPRYFSHSRPYCHDLGYLIIEYVDQGKMLSSSWEKHRHDPRHRGNLFRDLSRIMLQLSKIPQPRIGSWTIDNQGVLFLTNRPLDFTIDELENLRIPTGMRRDLTYSSVEPYWLDILSYHDSRIRHQPNSIHDENDGQSQLAALTIMRTLVSKFTNRRLRNGPFVMSLTDLHQSNIFVDDDWNITGIIDLEWACSRPIEMLTAPYWLTSHGLDEIFFHLDEYTACHDEFLDAIEKQEKEQYQRDTTTQILRHCWKTGTFWYIQALNCPSALSSIFSFHILPKFGKFDTVGEAEIERQVLHFWDTGALDFIAAKVKQNAEYNDQVRAFFTTMEKEVNEAKSK